MAFNAQPAHASCRFLGCGKVTHVVFIIKENRTFDSMFGRFPGANGVSTYEGSDHLVHALGHLPDGVTQDVDHSLGSARLAMDRGQMDEFGLVPGAVQRNPVTHAVFNATLSQYHRSDIPNYWRYASRFTLADTVFSTVASNSVPNHLYTITGQTNCTYNVDTMGRPIPKWSWGCDAPASTLFKSLSSKEGVIYAKPCFDFLTLSDRLHAAHTSWACCAPSYGRPGYI